MTDNWEYCLEHVLHSEGGYVNHPADPGGITNHGVTKRVWEEWVGHTVTEEDMRALTHEDVAPLYRKRYWDAIQGDSLPTGLDLCVFDCAVNAGVNRAAKFLQRSLNVAQDGVIGPATLKAVSEGKVIALIADFCAQREMHYRGLPTFGTFGRGWMARLDRVEDEAREMAHA